MVIQNANGDLHEMLPKLSLKRKPGGQPGNLNAFKHGFYSRRFRALEMADLDTALTSSLDDDIALMCVCIRRMFDLADSNAETLEDWLSVMSGIGKACTRRASLIRTQHLITGGKGNDIVSMLSESIGIVANELGINKQK